MFHEEHFYFYSISDKEFISYLSSKEYFIAGAINSFRLVGYVICLIAVDEAEIIYLCVHPNYRRIGIAAQILQYFIQNTSFLKKLHLEVIIHNANAISFYKKEGFIITHVRKNYSNGCDAYSMIKLL
jgi:ribosomal protein S18 acetylase RimI-like enzyme